MELLSYILSSIIVVATPLIFVKILLNPKLRNDKSKVIVAILVALISSVLIYKYLDGIFRSIMMLAIYTFVITQTYAITIKKAIVLAVIFIVLLVVSEVILALVVINILKIPYEYSYETLAGSLLSNILIYSLTFLIIFTLVNLLKSDTEEKNEFNTKIIIFSLLIFLSILIFFYDIIMNIKIDVKVILYIITIFTFISAFIIVIFQENKNYKLNTEYEKLLEFMKIYETELEKERIIKHEFKNQLITIK